MDKRDELIKETKRMLDELSMEHTQEGGFNEYSQFCEELLYKITKTLSPNNLKWIMKKIEDASKLGIKKSP